MDHSPGFLRLVADAKSRIHEVSIADVKGKLQRKEAFELIDVREDSEWAAGHVPGSRHLGRGVLERDVEKALPNVDTEIVLYCGGGFRSALAADVLRTMGYRRVASMDGGWKGWVEGGGAVER